MLQALKCASIYKPPPQKTLNHNVYIMLLITSLTPYAKFREKRGKLVRRREEEKVEEREKENGEQNSQADHPVIR